MFFEPVIRTSFASPSYRAPNPRAPTYPRFDRNFARFVNAVVGADAVQLDQSDTQWNLTLDLPGIARDALDISIEGSVLRIDTKEGAKRAFNAAYELPGDIDVAASTAKLEDGVLSLTLAKLAEQSKATKLTVS